MGWNAGWTMMEQTVIAVYDSGKLDKALLLVLVQPYSGTDIDYGGHRGLKTKDGKDVIQVIVEIMRPRFKPSKHEGYYEAFRKIIDKWKWM